MKKGFALIELLGVLVIISIISLITIPIALNTVERVKKQAFKTSIESIITALELEIGTNGVIKENEYIVNNGKITPNIKINKKIDGNGFVHIDDHGCIKLVISNNNWHVIKEYSDTTLNIYDGKYDFEDDEFVNADTSGASTPQLGTNMIPVIFDGGNWIKADKTNQQGQYEWYNYSQKKWANVVTVNNENREKYNKLSNGSVIDLDDVYMFFVWIPRYVYKINGFEKSIDIKFVSPIENTIDYYTLPSAFDFDYDNNGIFDSRDKLNGIWVNKFEISKVNDDYVSKPNMIFANNTSLANYVKYSIDLTTKLQKNTDLGYVADVHVIKNSEWGAIAYLTNSKYGRCTENICEEVEKNGHTMTGYYNQKNDYSTSLGMKTSTTGNIYGIYDMVGGLQEMVMGTVNISMLNMNIDKKYYDDYTENSYINGDATIETANWFSDASSTFDPNSWSKRWYIRGGNKNTSNDLVGIFSYQLDGIGGGGINNTRFVGVTN